MINTKNPKNIWVYQLANGEYSFGEYINAKKRVFLRGKLDEALASKLSKMIALYTYNNHRPVHFTGAMLPAEFLAQMRTSNIV